MFLVLLCSSRVFVLKFLDFEFVRSKWQKKDERTVLLVEDIDHTICIIIFDSLVLNVYGNLSISSTSPFKSMVFSYLHGDVIDIVHATTITISVIQGLIKTHVEFIKKDGFLRSENFSMKAKIDYDKGDFDWMIELFIATKMKTISSCDLPIKLHFLPKDAICNFSRRMF
jgi:hypothetical protein